MYAIVANIIGENNFDCNLNCGALNICVLPTTITPTSNVYPNACNNVGDGGLVDVDVNVFDVNSNVRNVNKPYSNKEEPKRRINVNVL